MTIRKPLVRPLPKPSTTAPQARVPAKVPLKRPAVQTPASTADSGDGFAVARDIRAKQQREAEARKNRPVEFRMAVGEGGDKGVQVAIVDTQRLDSKNPATKLPHFRYMHRWGYEQNKSHVETCTKDSPSGCSLCKITGKEGAYEMELTVIDKRDYTYTKGQKAGQTIKGPTRKLMTIKTAMIGKYERLYKQHGTFRGMIIRLFRDGPKDANTGSQVEFVRFLTAAEMANYAKDKEKNLTTPIDYDKAFPRLSVEDQDKLYGEGGSGGGIGSADFGDDDNIPF